MLPRWHILFGALFALFIWVITPDINVIYVLLAFLASFLMDFDHYLASATKTKKLSFLHSLDYHKEMQKTEEKELNKGIRRKGDFHIFHTVEFHLLVAVLGLLWTGFFYIFIGMLFHSFLDLGYSLHKDRFYRREYFLINWLKK